MTRPQCVSDTPPLVYYGTRVGASSSSKAKFTQGTNEQTTENGGICHLRSQHTGGKKLKRKSAILPLRDYGGKTPAELAERPDVVVVVVSPPARLPTYLPSCLPARSICLRFRIPTYLERPPRLPFPCLFLRVCTLAPAAAPGSAHSSILAFAPLDFILFFPSSSSSSIDGRIMLFRSINSSHF